MAMRLGRKPWDQVYEMSVIEERGEINERDVESDLSGFSCLLPNCIFGTHGRTSMIPRQSPEFAMQCALFNWRNLLVAQYPALRLLRGSMNGVKLTKAQAGKAKAAGMLKGEHDVTLPVRRGGYIGLSVELKHGRNKPTKDQLDYGEMLTAEGWFVAYFWEWTEAADLIQKYLQGKIIKA